VKATEGISPPVDPGTSVATVDVINRGAKGHKIKWPWRISFRLPITIGVTEGATSNSDSSQNVQRTGQSGDLCVAAPQNLPGEGASHSRRSLLSDWYHAHNRAVKCQLFCVSIVLC